MNFRDLLEFCGGVENGLAAQISFRRQEALVAETEVQPLCKSPTVPRTELERRYSEFPRSPYQSYRVRSYFPCTFSYPGALQRATYGQPHVGRQHFSGRGIQRLSRIWIRRTLLKNQHSLGHPSKLLRHDGQVGPDLLLRHDRG